MTRGITSLTTGLFTTVLFLVFALGGESFPSENTSQEILDKIDKVYPLMDKSAIQHIFP